MVVYISYFTPGCAHCAMCSDRLRHLTLVPTTAQGLGMRAVRRSAYAFYVPYWVFFFLFGSLLVALVSPTIRIAYFWYCLGACVCVSLCALAEP